MTMELVNALAYCASVDAKQSNRIQDESVDGLDGRALKADIYKFV